ncbi:MAG TPA: TIGR03560 family F420-dependent LLM class oxidoreductase, partial [Acidimicrobiales bacterium]|nr:TIGR03560 family F420-dependent LLM class oxidoreductase [Acidimicrobiales bacterium]
MKLSIWPNAAQDWAVILEEVKHCEDAGWDGAYIADHFMPSFGDDAGPTGEAVALLGALAAATERVRLGSLVFGNTYRHPAVLTKQVATVDHVSGGRVLFGIGAGWQENEHAAYGIDLPPVGERLDRFEEAVQVVRGLTSGERFSFSGRHYAITDSPPANPGRRLDLLIGGGGEKRTMRIAAQYADEWNVWSTPEIMRGKVEVLRRHCDALGRDAGEIKVSTQALVFMSDDEGFLENMRGAEMPMATMIGTPKQVGEILA